jgi:hypothetical protein
VVRGRARRAIQVIDSASSNVEETRRPTPDAASGAASSSAATTTLPAGPSSKIQVQPKRLARWPRGHVPDPIGRRVASDALDLAAQKLTQPACANDLLTTFTDQSGRPLSVRLGELSLDVQTYLTMVAFIDASRETLCVRGADLMLYGSTTLVAFYLTFDSSYSYTRLGRVQDPTGLAQALGPRGVRVVFSKDY